MVCQLHDSCTASRLLLLPFPHGHGCIVLVGAQLGGSDADERERGWGENGKREGQTTLVVIYLKSHLLGWNEKAYFKFVQGRTDAYRDAVVAIPTLLKNAVVMDVGFGTGILSFFAAQAGASKVIAVDGSSKMTSMATEIAKANGFLKDATSFREQLQGCNDDSARHD